MAMKKNLINIPPHILDCKEDFIKIDFFCIGVAKCGSTWLAQCLDEHPHITIAKGKEPNFFVKKLTVFDNAINDNFLRSWKWYRSFFCHAPPNNKLGDCSIHLFHNIPEAPMLIKYFYPNAKLILILRDPVKRLYSNFWFEKLYNNVRGVPDTFEDALHNKEFLYRSKYYAQLIQWLRFFPITQFFIITDIELSTNLKKVIQNLFSFIGVDKNFIPPSLNIKINESCKAGWPRLLGLKIAKFLRARGLDKVVDSLNNMGVRDLINKISIRKISYPPMDSNTEIYLRNYFLSDIEQLEVLTGKDLTRWKTI